MCFAFGVELETDRFAPIGVAALADQNQTLHLKSVSCQKSFLLQYWEGKTSPCRAEQET